MNTAETCTRCGAVLNSKRMVTLELNSTTGEWFPYTEGVERVDPDDSQGLHPFGSACAKAQLKEQKATSTDMNDASLEELEAAGEIYDRTFRRWPPTFLV